MPSHNSVVNQRMWSPSSNAVLAHPNSIDNTSQSRILSRSPTIDQTSLRTSHHQQRRRIFQHRHESSPSVYSSSSLPGYGREIDDDTTTSLSPSTISMSLHSYVSTTTPSLAATNPSIGDDEYSVGGESNNDSYHRRSYHRQDGHYYRRHSDISYYSEDDNLLFEDETNELALWDGIFWLEACRSISRSVTWFRLSSLVEGVREEAYRAGMWFAAGSMHLPPPPPPPQSPPPLSNPSSPSPPSDLYLLY